MLTCIFLMVTVTKAIDKATIAAVKVRFGVGVTVIF